MPFGELPTPALADRWSVIISRDSQCIMRPGGPPPHRTDDPDDGANPLGYAVRRQPQGRAGRCGHHGPPYEALVGIGADHVGADRGVGGRGGGVCHRDRLDRVGLKKSCFNNDMTFKRRSRRIHRRRNWIGCRRLKTAYASRRNCTAALPEECSPPLATERPSHAGRRTPSPIFSIAVRASLLRPPVDWSTSSAIRIFCA
jgi:hypothetical protein